MEFISTSNKMTSVVTQNAEPQWGQLSLPNSDGQENAVSDL